MTATDKISLISPADCVPTYPKIETLFDRDEKTFKINLTQLRIPEAAQISHWHVYEKLDGMNFRLAVLPDGRISFGGRTDAAQFDQKIFRFVDEQFSGKMDLFRKKFADNADKTVVIFGELFGSGIQKGGRYFDNDGKTFKLAPFDVLIGDIWLNQDSVKDISRSFGMETAPYLGCWKEKDIIQAVSPEGKTKGLKSVFGDFEAEGVIARTEPILFTRMGKRLMWKLKGRDF